MAVLLHAGAGTGDKTVDDRDDVRNLRSKVLFLNSKMCFLFFFVLLIQHYLTPLNWAVREGHADCVDLLLRSGADANANGLTWGEKWDTPLNDAVALNKALCVQILIENGADIRLHKVLFF